MYQYQAVSSNPSWFELTMGSTSDQFVLKPKIPIASASVYLRAGAFEIILDLSDKVALYFVLKKEVTDG